MATCWRPPLDQWDRVKALLPWRQRIELWLTDRLFMRREGR